MKHNKIDPELIEGLNKINNAFFNFIVKADSEAEKHIKKGKILSPLLDDLIQSEDFSKLQETRKKVFGYLADLSAEAEKALSHYKK